MDVAICQLIPLGISLLIAFLFLGGPLGGFILCFAEVSIHLMQWVMELEKKIMENPDDYNYLEECFDFYQNGLKATKDNFSGR